MKNVTKIVSTLASILIVGCLNNPVHPASENENQASPLAMATRSGLETNLAKWQSARLADYHILIRADRHSFPLGWMQISVIGSQPAKIDSVPGEEAFFDPNRIDRAPTIEYLFDRIDAKLADTCWTVGVQYDLKYGYPKLVEFKYRGEVMDADMSFEVANLWPGHLPL